MHSTRTPHLFPGFSIPIAAFLIILAAVVSLLATGCGGEEPASPGGDARPQGTAESRPRESGPVSGSASTNTPEPTAQAAPQQRSATAGASTPRAATSDPTHRGQPGTTTGLTEQPAPTTTAGGQSGSAPGQTEEPTPTVAPTPTGPPPCPPTQGSPETDKEALIDLYNAMDGEHWPAHRKGGWMSRSPLDQWSGVTTNDEGRVTSLDLSWIERFRGEIPPEVSNLDCLHTLDLSDNQLSGEIPPELGNLANLRMLDLSDNQLSREIPPELGNLANLDTLNLSRNQLSGEIPIELVLSQS